MNINYYKKSLTNFSEILTQVQSKFNTICSKHMTNNAIFNSSSTQAQLKFRRRGDVLFSQRLPFVIIIIITYYTIYY